MSLPGRRPDPTPATPMAGAVETQDPADATVGHDAGRSRDQLPLTMGRDCEFSQGFQFRPSGQTAILLDRQIVQLRPPPNRPQSDGPL